MRAIGSRIKTSPFAGFKAVSKERCYYRMMILLDVEAPNASSYWIASGEPSAAGSQPSLRSIWGIGSSSLQIPSKPTEMASVHRRYSLTFYAGKRSTQVGVCVTQLNCSHAIEKHSCGLPSCSDGRRFSLASVAKSWKQLNQIVAPSSTDVARPPAPTNVTSISQSDIIETTASPSPTTNNPYP
ncbi:hypothetical protein B296_00027068 [Ensete ventricosum]|uniref:Uncharacterized protein n=1 Tax=Ensete ventricosum TaxID=4639 RepID=A0A426YXP3_ENSVE|nr:hypothetical protein B296_00027068 [Ensete ventricosum]